MESMKENVDNTKTPRRTRKTSVTEVKLESSQKASARKVLTDNKGSKCSSSEIETPSRSVKMLRTRKSTVTESEPTAKPTRSAKKAVPKVEKSESTDFEDTKSPPRKSTITESETTSKRKPSAKKIVPVVDELESASTDPETPSRSVIGKSTESETALKHGISAKKVEVKESSPTNPGTPSRAMKLLTFQTPSRSDAMAAAQTPRRSARKSIKPVQEYENIVAQKGLILKRAASSSVEEEDPGADAKWLPAVIGRASTKRGKKLRNKRLKRQKKLVEIDEQNSDVVSETKRNDDEEVDVKNKVKNEEEEEPAVDEQLEKSSEKEGDVGDDREDDLKKIENHTGNEALDGGAGELDRHQEETEVQTINNVPIVDEHKNDSLEEVTDSSMEGGDIELAAMPITADDMKSPKKIIQQSPPNKGHTSAATVDNSADDSDCIMLSLNESSRTEQSENGSHEAVNNESDLNNDMPSLLVCSDDEDVGDVCKERTKPKEAHQSAGTESESDAVAALSSTFDASIESSAKEARSESDEPEAVNGTFDAKDESPAKDTASAITPQTPVLRPSIARIPTPFKSAKSIVPDIIIESEQEVNSLNELPKVVVGPKEFNLKSSRKRSFSVCTDRPKKIVTFHSPANTTVAIYDGDLMENSKKEKSNSVVPYRKRSLSVTETDRDLIAYIKQNKPLDTPESRRKLPQPTSRTKMPNFAAIHQHQFKRMESISDHIARKAERAKILTNSATKAKPASIQKGLPVKNSVLRDFNKDSAGNRTLPVPKARQRIELSGVELKPKIEGGNTANLGLQVRSRSKIDLSNLDDLPSIDKISKFGSNSLVFASNPKLNKLPKPKFELATSTTKPQFISTTSIKPSVSALKSIVSEIQPNSMDSRPRFNLSTATDSQQNKPSNKLDERRKRLMDMYKSRSHPRTGDKNKEILKGVRTNRRFELQMMCRNRPK